MINVSDESCRENQNTHFMFSNVFSEKRAVYEIMWKNTLQSRTGHRWGMRTACWVTMATNTNSENVGLIFIAFPLQEWLREQASMLSYTYIACLVKNLLTDCRVVIKMHAVTNFEMTNRCYTKNQGSETLAARHSTYQTRLYSSNYIAELRFLPVTHKPH